MTKATKDYKSLSEELDVVLEELQSTDIAIDKAVEQYERGMELIEELQQQLEHAENKVKKVQADFGQK